MLFWGQIIYSSLGRYPNGLCDLNDMTTTLSMAFEEIFKKNGSFASPTFRGDDGNEMMMMMGITWVYNIYIYIYIYIWSLLRTVQYCTTMPCLLLLFSSYCDMQQRKDTNNPWFFIFVGDRRLVLAGDTRRSLASLEPRCFCCSLARVSFSGRQYILT